MFGFTDRIEEFIFNLSKCSSIFLPNMITSFKQMRQVGPLQTFKDKVHHLLEGSRQNIIEQFSYSPCFVTKLFCGYLHL